MKALVFAEKHLALQEIDSPVAEEGEAEISVLLAGICRTDLEIAKGYMDFSGVLGHEFVGRVERCESSKSLEGKRVVGEINIAPWENDPLARRHDPRRTVLGILDKNGVFAERVTLPVENLVEVPETVSNEQAVFVEPLAAALEITEQVQIRPTDGIAVFGDGKLGLLCARVLKLHGSDVTLIGRHEPKLAIGRSWGLNTALSSELDDRRFDIVVDATGRPEGLQQAIACTRPRGTLVLKTTTAAPPDFHTAPIVIDELTIVGSRCGPFEPAVRLLASGLVDPTPLIEARYPLSRALEAFEHAGRAGALKVLLECS